MSCFINLEKNPQIFQTVKQQYKVVFLKHALLILYNILFFIRIPQQKIHVSSFAFIYLAT